MDIYDGVRLLHHEAHLNGTDRVRWLAPTKQSEDGEGFVGCIAGETGNKEVGKTYCFINN